MVQSFISQLPVRRYHMNSTGQNISKPVANVFHLPLMNNQYQNLFFHNWRQDKIHSFLQKLAQAKIMAYNYYVQCTSSLEQDIMLQSYAPPTENDICTIWTWRCDITMTAILPCEGWVNMGGKMAATIFAVIRKRWEQGTTVEINIASEMRFLSIDWFSGELIQTRSISNRHEMHYLG